MAFLHKQVWEIPALLEKHLPAGMTNSQRATNNGQPTIVVNHELQETNI